MLFFVKHNIKLFVSRKYTSVLYYHYQIGISKLVKLYLLLALIVKNYVQKKRS